MTSGEMTFRSEDPIMKSTASRVGLNLLVWAGSAMLAASGLVHFHLWFSEGYRHIPTIGPLFLTQAIVGVALAIATAIFRRLILVAAGAGLAISSIGALLISIWWGLFNWQETSSAPYVGIAFAVESAAAVFLGVSTLLLAWPWVARIRSGRPAGGRRAGPLPPTGIFVASSAPLTNGHPAAGNKPSVAKSGPVD